MLRGVRLCLLVHLDRLGQIVGAIEQFPEQQRGGGEGGVVLERIDQEPARALRLAEQVGRDARPQQQRRLLRRSLQTLFERLRRFLCPPGVERLPARARVLDRRPPLRARSARKGTRDERRDDRLAHQSILVPVGP